MAASVNDYFQKVSWSTATTLSAPGYTAGVSTSINVGSTAEWETSTGITFAIDEVNSAGERIDGTYNVFRGVVSSATQISDVVYVGGNTERSYSAGATTRVYMLVSKYRENRLVDGILVHADQDGTLKAGAVDVTAVLADNVVTKAKMADNAIGNAELDTDLQQGWQAGTGTWTYASATTFTVPAADAANMQVGTKIKLTQTTAKYFYVTGVSGTTITVTGGTDYTLANAAITSPFFSNAASPTGFPHWFNYTPTWTNLTVGNGTLVGRFNIVERVSNFSISLVFGTTTSVTSTFPTATLPVTASSSGRGRTQIIYNDNGVANYYGVGFIAPNATTTVLTAISASGTYGSEIGVSSTVPFTFGNTDSVVIIGNFEV